MVRPGTGQPKFEGVGAIVLKQGPRQVLIQFIKEMPGLHSGEGEGAENRCWWIVPEHLMSYAELARETQRELEERKVVKIASSKPKKRNRWLPGNLIRLKEDSGWDRYVGVDAIVLEHYIERGEVLIQFQQEMDGLHDADGRGKPNRCLYVKDRHIVSYFEGYTGGVVTSSNVYSGGVESSVDVNDERPVTVAARSEGVVPPRGFHAEDLFEVYTDNVRINIKPLIQDAQDESPQSEEDIEEVEELVPKSPRQYVDRQARIAANYRMGRPMSDHEAAEVAPEVEQEPPPREREHVDVGCLSKVQNADGLRTPYDNQPATVIATGTFGRVLLQFDNRIPGGHNGKGIGEPGRCKWFYRKDVVGISIGEAVVMTERIKRTKKSRRPKPNTAIRSDAERASGRPEWLPGKIDRHQPIQSSQSMWDSDEASAPKKRVVSSAPASLPPITSKRFERGTRVVVISAPSDNSALKGQQGVIILDSPNNHNVTVQFDKRIPGCHDANGEGHPGRCWNIHKLLIKPVDSDVVFYIKGDYKRGNKNLKDMEVKILAHITHPTNESLSIVEFVEEIPQGHSADGKGKKAHCLSVPASIIGKKKKPEKKKIKTPHEVTAEKGAKKN
jgi:hypothetical protein